MRSVFIVLLIMVGMPVHAALVNNGSYTTDTVSDLDWLDLTETRNRSYDDISSQLDAGGEFAGWRYATGVEAEALFTQFGLPIGRATDDPLSAEMNASIILMSSYLGETVSFLNAAEQRYYGTLGIVGQSNSAGTHQRMGAYKFSNYFGDPWRGFPETDADAHSTNRLDSASYVYEGHYLVNSTIVPIPAAVWLFGSALAGLGWLRRKQTV
jgi:hypothetical protein